MNQTDAATRDSVSEFDTALMAGTHEGSVQGPEEAYLKMRDRALVLEKALAKANADKAVLVEVLVGLIRGSKSAEGLAWECGCETEDGVHTLLDDSRGDAYRELTEAKEKARAALFQVQT